MIQRPITGATLEGGMRMLDGKSPFARCAAILRLPGEKDYLRPHQWSGEEAVADVLEEEDFQGFVDTCQAFRWRTISDETVTAVPTIAVWILRPPFEDFMDYRTALGAVYAENAAIAHAHERRLDVRVIIVREDRAARVRDEWAMRTFDRAWQLASEHDWKAACEAADLAFVMTRQMQPDRVALYALALEKNGRKTAADGTIIMAERSRDKQFAEEMHRKLAEYRRDLEPPPRSEQRPVMKQPHLGPGLHKARQRSLQQAVGRQAIGS